MGGAGAVFWSGAGICLELEPEPKISKIGGSGNPEKNRKKITTSRTKSEGGPKKDPE